MKDPEELRSLFEARIALELGVKDTETIFARHNARKGQYIDERFQMGWFVWIMAHDEMEAETQTLRAVLRDIMTERLIPGEYPLLMARAKAALDGGGA